jgi:peptide/nickel transport system ATP-binding protein
MNKTLLEARALRVAFKKSDFVLQEMNFTICEGEIVAVIGESGSGKSTFLKAVTCLSDEDAIVSGEVIFEGNDLISMKEKKRRSYRFSSISVVFQNSKEYLNPRLTLREMLGEILKKEYSPKDAAQRACTVMELVGLDSELLSSYPASLSGGMVQKFQIACAIALSPKLIVLDEPTSSLDAASRSEFTQILRRISRESKTAIIIVTHDMALARDMTDRMLVMYRGMICEEGPSEQVLHQPRHPYTRALCNCAMELNLYKDVWGIREAENRETSHGCPFYGRCTQSLEMCADNCPELTESNSRGWYVACNRGGIIHVLESRHLKKSYGKKQVLIDCSLQLHGGEIVSLVGRSGSGKTTMCNIMAGFLQGDNGEVLFEGKRVCYESAYQKMHGLQFMMQDHSDSLNPHLSVYTAINEPLYLFGDTAEHHSEVKNALSNVGLESSSQFLNRKIHTLSGGQRQRVALARCLITHPSVLIADEPTSMLDGSSKANLIRLLKGLQNEMGFSMLIVTHDLACALKISDRIYLLQDGMLEEINNSLPPEKLEAMMYDSSAK